MDADALNVLSGSVAELAGRRAPLVLTPHLAELRRLTGRAVESREETWETAAVFARATGASILLKGRPSVVFGPDGSRVLIPTGNSGLATGGSGDILTGMIASLGGQGLRPADAAALAAFVHGLSADIIATGTSSRSILPTDVVEGIGHAFAFLENKPPEGLVRLEGRWHGRLWDIP
jgi:NAD(P)H-hydrate epimerase